MDIGGAGVGLRVASSVFQPLLKRLFARQGPGAGLVDKPVRVSALVAFKGEKRTLAEKDLRKLSEELVRRVVNAVGPHDAPSGDEVLIVSDVLSRSLIRLGELDMDDVQAVRLGHERLAERIGAPIDLFHSPGTYALYRRLLDQCCLHILNFFTQRSAFVARTLVEQSRQLDQLTTRIDLLIERVGHRSSEDAAFEQRYAAYIEREHSQLTIYGLDLHQEREWPLDDAYLSLETRRGGDARGDLDLPPQRAERALAGQERVLLRGLAGSGKTTLVQWLAVATARQDPDAGAADGMTLTHLLGRVPFVLPMRTLTRDGAPPPTPDRFLTTVHCPLAAAQPHGWIDRVLSTKRGLLLVDGIDEIPEAERDNARRWLRRVNASYPGNLWLVTVRPSAVREDWLADEAFTELTLTPMGSRDTQAFVHRWHVAVGAGPEVENALLDLIRSRSDLATLATNPQMCAMICALHRERRGYLPKGRKRLYDAALSMLLERRDRERPDPVRIEMHLDADTQISLIQKLAYWLANNGRSEMTRGVATSLLQQALPVVQGNGEWGPAEQVMRYLIERSGVLREPAAGAVDFVHRTFQDYLAAREIVEWQHFPALVERAHEDQWEDVVRMAVAHAQPPQRAELLTAIVERGDREPEERVRLHLLATACLEHATQLAAEVKALVRARAAKFIPPRTDSEAKSLANVGSVVLELLPGPEGLTDDEASAVVITAGEIGSEAALTRLRAFRNHPSHVVRSRLMTYQDHFDANRYFEDILSHLSRESQLELIIMNHEGLRLLGTLEGLTMVNLIGNFAADDILANLSDHAITSLCLQNNDRLRDLHFLAEFRHLDSLMLNACSNVDDVSPLTTMPLQHLFLWNARTPRGLPDFTSLRSLTGITDIRTLSELPLRAPLERLSLPDSVTDLTGIAAWPGLKRIQLAQAPQELTTEECQALATLSELKEIALNPKTLISMAASGVQLPGVTSTLLLPLIHGEPLLAEDMKQIAKVLPGLKRIFLQDDPEDFAPLARLPKLRRVEVSVPSKRVNVPPHIEVTAPPAPRY
jgi:hypothetical protein